MPGMSANIKLEVEQVGTGRQGSTRGRANGLSVAAAGAGGGCRDLMNLIASLRPGWEMTHQPETH